MKGDSGRRNYCLSSAVALDMRTQIKTSSACRRDFNASWTCISFFKGKRLDFLLCVAGYAINASVGVACLNAAAGFFLGKWVEIQMSSGYVIYYIKQICI